MIPLAEELPQLWKNALVVLGAVGGALIVSSAYALYYFDYPQSVFIAGSMILLGCFIILFAPEFIPERFQIDTSRGSENPEQDLEGKTTRVDSGGK